MQLPPNNIVSKNQKFRNHWFFYVGPTKNLHIQKLIKTIIIVDKYVRICAESKQMYAAICMKYPKYALKVLDGISIRLLT